VTARNLRELEIDSSPLISKLYSPEIWPQLTAQEPGNTAVGNRNKSGAKEPAGNNIDSPNDRTASRCGVMD
jgi:hypothetical protein